MEMSIKDTPTLKISLGQNLVRKIPNEKKEYLEKNETRTQITPNSYK